MDRRVVFWIVLVLISVLCIVFICLVYSTNKALETAITTEPEHLDVSDEILILSGYIGAESVDIMTEPSEDSETVGSLGFNEKIEYKIYNDDWFEVANCDIIGYVSSKHILDEDTGYSSYDQYVLDNVVGYTLYDVPETSGFKSYMDYRAITATSTRQHKLQNRYAETGDYGIRMVHGRYCIALGSYFTDNVGQYVDLILENGVVIPCVLADQKSDVHTDSNNIVTTHNGCMSEFIVDSNLLDDYVKRCGNISVCNDGWSSRVAQIKVYNKNVFDN